MNDADLQVVDVDLTGDRRLLLQHRTSSGRLLHKPDAEATLRYLATLWGYEVQLEEVDAQDEHRLHLYTAKAPAIP
ncbi:MAG: hypothetical protein WDN49_15735 [Acetobacteraceae bacterium]